MTSLESKLQPFAVSNDALRDGAELRERMARDGYLFFQRLLSQESIGKARAEITALLRSAGWLKEGTEPITAIAAPGANYVEPSPAYMLVYSELIKGEAFNRLALDPALIALFDALFGEPTLAHARNIARVIFPHNTLYTTPSHQDYIHIQGSMETYTAWIPLGDCPAALGSLAVLQGSHKAGVLPVESAYGAGGLGIDTEKLPYTWVGSDFACGDVVVFHSLTVHKALPNLADEQIRLSVDFRYQPLSHPVDPSSLAPHHNRLTWEDIYANWQSDAAKYYWRDTPVRYAEHDPKVLELRAAANQKKETAKE